jgi:hypothetical protein
VVVALHLVVEHLWLASARVRHQVLVEQAEDVRADIFELFLNLDIFTKIEFLLNQSLVLRVKSCFWTNFYNCVKK